MKLHKKLLRLRSGMRTPCKTNILFILLTAFTLIFAGCSKVPDCSAQDTEYEKYKLNQETTTCDLFNEIEKNKCGNKIPEADNDETYCNCKQDVPKSHPTMGCDGTKGEYLEYACTQDKECELQENNKVISQKKSIELRNSDVTFRANFDIKVPFILNTIEDNKMSVNIDYFKGPASSSIKLSNFVVKEIILKNSAGIIFGTKIYGEQITSTGQKLQTKYFELSDTTKYSSKENLKVEFIISYKKDTYDSKGTISRTEDKIETLKVGIGSWDIINPNFEIPTR